MSTDKTLADVQPGGRVRLGNQAERARFDEFLSRNPLMALCAGTAWQVWQAALSAQPSPGGQDALSSELLEHAASLERMAASDRETGDSIEQAIENGEGYTPDEPQDVAAGLQHDATKAEETASLLRKAATAIASRQPVTMDDALTAGDGTLHGTIYHWQERALRAEAELAARQPVGESVEEDVYCAIADMIEPYVQREGINPNGELPASVHDSVSILLDHWLKTRQPVGEPVGTVHSGKYASGMPWCEVEWHIPQPAGTKLYTAPPAQAVDLGRARASIQSLLNWIDDWAETPEESGIDAIEAEAEAVLALIDSQVVGNGH